MREQRKLRRGKEAPLLDQETNKFHHGLGRPTISRKPWQAQRGPDGGTFAQDIQEQPCSRAALTISALRRSSSLKKRVASIGGNMVLDRIIFHIRSIR